MLPIPKSLHQAAVIDVISRSAKVGDEIGGHNVSGHVHTTARIASVEDTENNKRVSFEVAPQPFSCPVSNTRRICMNDICSKCHVQNISIYVIAEDHYCSFSLIRR